MNMGEKRNAKLRLCDYKIIGKGHTLFGVIKHFKMRKEI